MKSSNKMRERLAFTLPEVMVTLAVTMLVMAGLLTTHLFGLRLSEFTKPKLCASDNARVAVSHLVGELRSATRIRVGQGSFSTFTEVAMGAPQQANAIQIYPTTNTSYFSRYYWDVADNKLKRITNGSTGAEVIANSVSNQLVFTSEDYAGHILTNTGGNRVIGVTLQFSQIEYPVILIGTNQFYDFYQLRTRVTQRKLPQS
jgi:Prokaryotic N-terminal methylation motif